MRWTSPEYLLLLPVLAGLLWWSWRLVSGLQRGRKITAFVLRGLLVLALVRPWRGRSLADPTRAKRSFSCSTGQIRSRSKNGIGR